MYLLLMKSYSKVNLQYRISTSPVRSMGSMASSLGSTILITNQTDAFDLLISMVKYTRGKLLKIIIMAGGGSWNSMVISVLAFGKAAVCKETVEFTIKTYK